MCDISIFFSERNLLHKVTAIFTISYKCGEFDLICVKLRSCKSSYELFLNANRSTGSLNWNYNDNSNMKNVIRMYLNERSSTNYNKSMRNSFVFTNSYAQILTTKYLQFIPHKDGGWLEYLAITQNNICTFVGFGQLVL